VGDQNPECSLPFGKPKTTITASPIYLAIQPPRWQAGAEIAAK
jgi:hypothetical protein